MVSLNRFASVHTDFSWVWEYLPAGQQRAGGQLDVKAMVLFPQLHTIFSRPEPQHTLDRRVKAQIYFGTQQTIWKTGEVLLCLPRENRPQPTQNAVV